MEISEILNIGETDRLWARYRFDELEAEVQKLKQEITELKALVALRSQVIFPPTPPPERIPVPARTPEEHCYVPKTTVGGR